MVEIPKEDREYFENMGEEAVRLQFNPPGFNSPQRQFYAREWLAEHDKAARKRLEALQAEQTLLGRIAAYGAIGAIGVGAIGVIIGILARLYPRH